MIKKNITATVTLAVITPILTELFSSNMGPWEVLNPVGFFFMFMAYGVPVIMIREIAVRAKTGLPGLFLMGLAYSIFNEGIIAKTLFTGPPGGGMEIYDAVETGGIHLVWTALITTWHAIHAVVFPIAVTGALFPAVRGRPWLNRPVTAVFLVVWVPVGFLAFVNFLSAYARWEYFALFVAAMTLLVLAGRRTRGPRNFFDGGTRGSGRQVLLGIALFPALVIAFFVGAETAMPAGILIAWPYCIAAVTGLVMWRAGWTTCVPVAFVALGDYCCGSLFTLLIQLGVDPPRVDKIVTLAVLFAVLAAIIPVALRHAKRGGNESATPPA